MIKPVVTFSAWCAQVAGAGWACMVCTGPELEAATGHMVAGGGPYEGRLLALLCAYHAGPDGAEDVNEESARWVDAGLLGTDLGPGPRGVPPVLHRDPGDPGWHLDPLPVRLVHADDREDT